MKIAEGGTRITAAIRAANEDGRAAFIPFATAGYPDADTSLKVAVALIDAEKFGYGPAYLDEYPSRIRAVTREQANAAIRKYLHPDRLHLVVAGDLEELP